MSGRLDHAPIFLGGVAGSGKTRLGVLLGRHPRIAVIRRTYLWREFFGRYGDLAEGRNLRRCVTDMMASSGVLALGLDPDVVWDEVAAGPPTYGHVFAVIHGLHARAQGKARWCDQLGLVEVNADVILRAYPTAKMIHMLCDPSSLPAPAGPPGTTGWMIGKWLTSAESAVHNAARYGDRYLIVRHEDLRADEHDVMNDVCGFLGESIAPASMLIDSPDPIPSERSCSGLHDPYLAARVADAMHCFRYEPLVPIRTGTIRQRLVERPANRIALTAWSMSRARSIEQRSGSTDE